MVQRGQQEGPETAPAAVHLTEEVQLKKTEGKLKNQNFLANAPADIVEKEKEKLETFTANLAKIQENIKRLQELA